MEKNYSYITVFVMLQTCCILMFSKADDTFFIEEDLSQREEIIFYGGFEENYNNLEWETDWGIQWVNRTADNVIIKNGFNNSKSLRVIYPEGGLGPSETGTQFPMVFNDMPGIENGLYQELYLRYYIKFENEFDFRLGGKLPGLMGGGDSWTRSGGNQPDGTNGWTLRFMWREEGKLVVYAYVPKSNNGKWGSETWGQDIDCEFIAIPGKWHCIEQYVNIGTPGKDDGKLKVWINGIKRLDISDLCFWYEKNDNGKIGGVFFSTFHGGNTPEWSPRVTSYAQYDEIIVAKSRIGLMNSDPHNNKK
ncbi:polysaccharide lyase [Bacteroidota bacterium]